MLFNNYESPEVHFRKRIPGISNSEHKDHHTPHPSAIHDSYNSKIHVNSFILLTILLALFYFNSDTISERFQQLLVRANSPTTLTSTTSGVTSQSIPILISQSQQTTALHKEQSIRKNDKINWEGCLYEIPTPPSNRKHIVTPPSGPITLVCCNTTAGVLNIEVHHEWAYNGANRFLDMVRAGFFSTKVS